ncbi:MAG: hypothetical protein JO131_03155, partial [Gammaproteobacteria bacterium]|nr:hypothetical protein [Gammaproteobacteria bacterium]
MQRGKEQLIVNLKEVISEEIKSTPVILEEKKQKSIIPNFSLNQKLRAKEIIVDFFRTAKITKHFYQKDGYQTYINMLLPNDEKDKIDGELNELMKIMFGRTIAAIKDEPDFPFVNPNVHKDAFYHRDDDLTSPFLNKILADFEDKRNTQRFIYIPYTILKTLPIHEVIKIYLEEYTKNINVLTDNKSNIGFLKIDKKNKSASELCNIHSIIRSTGMIASPWQLAQYYVQHNSLKQNNHTNTSHSMFRLHLPNNFKEFLTNKKIIELKLLAQSNHPTHYLAQSLFNLFSQLRQINIDKNSLKRMYTFLSIGLNFYKKNYPRFAMITYGIIHEMTAILCKMQPLHNVINYSKFKQAAEENAISYFHIENKSFGEDCKYRSIALPANSGMNAHVIAIKLAKQMTVDGKKVNDEVYRTGPFYYEFDNINDSITDDKSAYIYLVSSGSIMSAKLDTTIPGVDINKIIKKRILLDEKKPVTLVIDCTSGLYKYLKLEPEIQRWVIRGMLSIIVYESHQKFGLLHTDQAQYGRVFGLCSKEHFSEDFIKELERNAAIDIENIPDMAIGAFIDIACGDVLEKIKEQHFLNGDVFRKAFEKWGFLPEVHTYEDMLDNKKDLFFINYFTRSALGRAITKGIKLRDSFAHFTTTCSGIGTLVRLSANASDKIDILIIACQLYIASQKLPINILHSLFTEYLLLFQSQGHSLFEDEIIFFSVANILGKN